MRYTIIGNGVAGTTAALRLARTGEEVIVYTSESYPYYYRPRLPYFLAGEIEQEELYLHPAEWYAERGIQVRYGTRVTRLLLDKRELVLEGDQREPYDRLLLATGGYSFVPPIAGAERKGVFTLRTLDDALAIREYAQHSEQAVVIGGGLLGLETARGLKVLGLDVTVLEFFPRLLPRQLDVEGATIFQKLVEGLGVQVAVGAETEEIEGNGEVRGVRLKDGRRFPAQMVVIAAGVRSEARLATEAGLPVERGIVVDGHMRTAAPDVFAAGDAASFNGRVWGIIPVAQEQARVAALNMAGEEAVYEEVVPSNTLKIVGIDLTSAGTVHPDEGTAEELRRADPEAGRYVKFVWDGERLIGAIVLGNKALAQQAEKLVTKRTPVSREELEALLTG